MNSKTAVSSIDLLTKKEKRYKLESIWHRFKMGKNLHKNNFSKFFQFPRKLNIFIQALLSSGRHRKFNIKNSVVSNVLKPHNKEFLNLNL